MSAFLWRWRWYVPELFVHVREGLPGSWRDSDQETFQFFLTLSEFQLFPKSRLV